MNDVGQYNLLSADAMRQLQEMWNWYRRIRPTLDTPENLPRRFTTFSPYIVYFVGFDTDGFAPNNVLSCKRLDSGQPTGDPFKVRAMAIDKYTGTLCTMGCINLDDPAAPVMPRIKLGQKFWVEDRNGEPWLKDIYFIRMCTA